MIFFLFYYTFSLQIVLNKHWDIFIKNHHHPLDPQVVEKHMAFSSIVRHITRHLLRVFSVLLYLFWSDCVGILSYKIKIILWTLKYSRNIWQSTIKLAKFNSDCHKNHLATIDILFYYTSCIRLCLTSLGTISYKINTIHSAGRAISFHLCLAISETFVWLVVVRFPDPCYRLKLY